MGLFSSRRREPEPEPVRRDAVLRLVRLHMIETEEAERDIDSKRFELAQAARNAAAEQCTRAELAAAMDAIKRHGYV